MKEVEKAKQMGGLSEDVKTIIVVLLLVFVYPAGLIMMFVWMRWRWWVKLLVALPVVFLPIALGGMAVAMLLAINPRGQINKAFDAKARNEALSVVTSTKIYLAERGNYPWGGIEEEYRSDDVYGEGWYQLLVEEGFASKRDVSGGRVERPRLMLIKEAGAERLVRVCFEPRSGEVGKVMCVPEAGL